MKNANLFIGLGIGLLIGAAAGIYFASGDEQKEQYMDEINSKVDKAKEKINHVAQEAISRVKAHRI
jgi:gas vesicle protein